MIRALRLATILLAAPLAVGRAQILDYSAQALPAWHHASRTPEPGSRSELRLLRPVVMARFGSPSVGLLGTLNFEGLTIPDGELVPGAWGEGFVDRRHPHTYVHELLLEARAGFGCGSIRCRVGGFIGKGFVPFGSDDPMSRPFIRYPINHHLAQILERAVLGAQVEAGPLRLEASLFNGDEPERPGQWPRIGGRFGDSWSLRATVTPIAGLELRGSAAAVRSPEHRPGAGGDQRKRHLELALDRPLGGTRVTALAEWARTSELDGFFVFDSRLAEIGWRRGRLAAQYRFEATDRPEEERLSAYRSARPHLENTILGITRWTTHTAGVSLGLPPLARSVETAALVEITGGRVHDRRPGVFDLRGTYGGDRFWTVSVGLDLQFRTARHRMGRYGVAVRHD